MALLLNNDKELDWLEAKLSKLDYPPTTLKHYL